MAQFGIAALKHRFNFVFHIRGNITYIFKETFKETVIGTIRISVVNSKAYFYKAEYRSFIISRHITMFFSNFYLDRSGFVMSPRTGIIQS